MEITPHYQKDIECLYCKKTFKTTKLRSKFVKVEKQESDFQPIYLNNEANPLFYNVFVCEHCGFSFTDDFTKYFAPGVKEEIQQKISANWTPHSFGEVRSISEAISAYKLAYLSGTVKKEKTVATAGLALRTAWLYRINENHEQEHRFLTIARNLYSDSYSNEDYSGTQMSELRIIYIIAEISRRIGDRELATRFFSKALEKQSSSIEPKLIEMAKEQWQIMREEKEKGAN